MQSDNPGNFNSRSNYDWYQNDTNVFITIRITNLKENDVKVTIINDMLDVMCQMQDGRQFRMHFNLSRSVIVQSSNWAVDSAKLCITLRKSDRKRWSSLELMLEAKYPAPKSFVGLVEVKDPKLEFNKLWEDNDNRQRLEATNSSPITITQARSENGQPDTPLSLDYNWYQNEEFITVVIHVPNIEMYDKRCFLFYEDDISIVLNDNNLNWICIFPTGLTNVNFRLYRAIDSANSRYEITPDRQKIEIKLKKVDNSFWKSFCAVEEPETAAEEDNKENPNTDSTPDESAEVGEIGETSTLTISGRGVL